ncbi:MAG: aminotransferase class I/II-fold pyridoxal phosphate-dependent enzyme [Phycisphaerales bacterium JB037]
MTDAAPTSRSARTVTIANRELLSFGGCDYLGLAHHYAVREAFARAIDRWGISVSASRATTGNTAAHDKLEHRLASFTGLESATLLPEGFLANIAAMQTLSLDHDLVVLDARAHRSLADAARTAGLAVERYPFRDHRDAAELAARAPTRAIIATDSVFAADASLAPVAELAAAARDTRSTLLLDDCHALGVLGQRGRGSIEHFALDPALLAPADLVITSTLAKGIGCYGSFAGGTRAFTGRLRAHASAYICTTPVPPAIADAALAALNVHTCELDRLSALRANAARLHAILAEIGLARPRSGDEADLPVATFSLTSDSGMEDLQRRLAQRHLWVPLIRYPGGPAPRYFRISVTAEHTADDLDLLAAALAEDYDLVAGEPVLEHLASGDPAATGDAATRADQPAA